MMSVRFTSNDILSFYCVCLGRCKTHVCTGMHKDTNTVSRMIMDIFIKRTMWACRGGSDGMSLNCLDKSDKYIYSSER